jgi:hypothetical protein
MHRYGSGAWVKETGDLSTLPVHSVVISTNSTRFLRCVTSRNELPQESETNFPETLNCLKIL